MASPAERQRRYRRHMKGDHSLCDAARCEYRRGARSAEPLQVTVGAPAGRGPRGGRLWADMDGGNLAPTQRLLLEEICRLADRLDRLDALIDGRENWLQLNVTDDTSEVIVTVDNLLAEARQHATALRGLVAELRASLPKSAQQGLQKPTQREGGLSDLTARIAARRGAPAG